ncbi:hypothetical protein HanPI659440_Chr04g0169491 [Helianthus annuus]|nr:hypothetical protein HanPI659440_Chr04g0169491 [Helianthus annuus]
MGIYIRLWREKWTSSPLQFLLFSLLSSNLQVFLEYSSSFPGKFAVLPPFSYIPVSMAEEESVQVEEGPLPVLKWDQGLFEQITRGFQFPPEWDARYPRQGQTVADAPPGPAGMVRVRHFEFLCRSQGMEPTVEKFRAFYQLIRNIGFYSFGNRGAAKKILIGPPKSFHDWKMKFFFIREEVMPIAMIFRESDKIEKEELPIPKRG